MLGNYFLDMGNNGIRQGIAPSVDSNICSFREIITVCERNVAVDFVNEANLLFNSRHSFFNFDYKKTASIPFEKN